MFNLKKVVLLIFCFCFYISPVLGIDLALDSKNAILYNLDEDKILYEYNSEEEIAIASLTKIMTSLVVLDNVNLNDKVVINSSDFFGLAEAGASVAGLKLGQILTYDDLLYALLLPSGADAAQALVRSVAGSRSKFVEMMNEKAQEIGLLHTHFQNETGLDSDGAYSTVKDVAAMFKYALANPDFKRIITTPKYQTSDGKVSFSSTVISSLNNSHVNMTYVLGGKTGTTKKAGKCLASIASFNGTNYLLVTARAPMQGFKNITDAKTIYDYFINNFHNQSVLTKNEIVLKLPTKYLKPDEVTFTAGADVVKYLPNDFTKEKLNYNYEGIETITKDNKLNNKLGTLTISYEDEVLANIDIILKEELEIDYLEIVEEYKIEILIGLGIFLVIIIGLILKIKRGKRRKKVKVI